MKNISVSNKVWKRLRRHRDRFNFKHYSKTIDFILTAYEKNQHAQNDKEKTNNRENRIDEDKMWDI